MNYIKELKKNLVKNNPVTPGLFLYLILHEYHASQTKKNIMILDYTLNKKFPLLSS